MSFFKTIETDIESIAAAIERELGVVLSDVEKLALTFVSSLGAGIVAAGPTLMSAVTQAVTAQAALELSGQEKFDQAVSAVAGTMASAGLTVGTNVVRGAIEAAVASLPGQAASQPPSP